MTYSKRFSSKFFAKMLQPAGPTSPVRDQKLTSLSLVFELLDEKKVKDFFIVETGCMRGDHGQLALGDDGPVHTSLMTSSTTMMVRWCQ